MTDEQPKDNTVTDPLAEMKAEFQRQLDELKKSQAEAIDALKAENQRLTSQNTDLQRAIVKGVFSSEPQQDKPKEKTPEELYAERVTSISNRILVNLGVPPKT